MFSHNFCIKNNVVLTLLISVMLLVLVKPGFAEQSEDVNNSLTIEQAGKIALSNDYLIKSYLDISNSLQQSSIAMNTLPDPKLKLGFLNYPDDTFKQNQEPMTQKKIGITQMFPKGDTLEIMSQREIIRSTGNSLRANERSRKVLESVRKAWLDVYYWTNAKTILDENRSLFKDLVDITEGQYASGKRRQVDYVQALLELDLLNDKDFMFSTREVLARAELAKWVGDANSRMKVTTKLPEFHEDIEILNDAQSDDMANKKLLSHPMILMSQNKIDVRKKSVELARQDYKPGWSLELSYSDRDRNAATGKERANFVTAMVMIDIPLFTGNRQDKRVASQLKQVSAAKNNFDDTFRILRTKLEKSHQKLKWLKKRIEHYNTTLFPRSKQNSEAALLAYQSDRSDFLSLIKARITEFKTELQFLRLNVDHVSTEATLSYLLGDDK